MNNIVIIGAGFAGLKAALKLEKEVKKLRDGWRIILIDKNSYHTFAPALYEAATAYNPERLDEKQIFEGLVGSAACLPVPEIIKGKNIHFVQGEISGIDLVSNTLKTRGGDLVSFQYLLLALGGEATHFNVKGTEKCCYDVKTIEDAIKIRRRIKDIFSTKKENINITVVGGGFSGVEVASEIATYVKHLADDKKINNSEINISIMEAGGELVTQAHPAMRKLIKKRLGKLGIDVRLNTRIAETLPDCVILGKDEKCESDIVIWSGGIKGPFPFKNIEGFELNERGMVVVDKFMRVNDFNYVFAAGDNASFTDEKSMEAPMTAFVAEQQADVAAYNIISSIRGKDMRSYKIYLPGYATSVGGRYAVGRIFGFTFSGFLGWIVKKFIDLRYFTSILPIKKAFTLWLRELKLFTRND